ncbi:MAG TPA: hypothetical protein VFP35_01125 [Candidatus Saccharimonadales bacterium]|nr:hypothetical protein [Candidatus Saccharimonadales bacterium]
MHRSEKSENLRDDKVLAGTSESGAEIIARSEYFTRREYREVFENLGTPYISSHKEWQTTDRIKGLKLEVVTAQDKSQRSVSLFLPDGLAPAGTYQHPLEIVLRTRFGVKTVKPDEADFKKLEDEIVYYLGDDVQWRAPSMEE